MRPPLGVAVLVTMCILLAGAARRQRRRRPPPEGRRFVRRGGTTPAADHERQLPGGPRHRDGGTRRPLGTPLRGNRPMGVSRALRRSDRFWSRSRRPARGRSSSRHSPSGSRRWTPFRFRAIRVSGRGTPSSSPRRSSPGSRGSSGCSTAPSPLPSANSYVLPAGADVRAFGAHESGGVWAVYAGVRPTGSLQGIWSPARHTLVFNPKPELTVAPPGSPGAVTQKVTGFADCAGALYSTINTTLYRRNDGALRSDVPRWVPVYRAPPVGPHNSGLRGITCLTHNGSPSLLVSTEGNGNVYRFDHLPRGQLDTTAAPEPGFGRRRAGADARVPTHPRHPSDAGGSGNDHPGNGKGFDRLRHRRLQQRRLPDHEYRRSRSAGVRVRVGLPGGLPNDAEVWTDRLGCGALQCKRLLRNSYRSGAIADLFAALPQRTDADAIGDGVQTDPLGPGLRVHPEHPVPHHSQEAGSTTAAMTATSTPPTARRGSHRRRSGLFTSPLRRKEDIHDTKNRDHAGEERRDDRLGWRRRPGAGAQRLWQFALAAVRLRPSG